MAALQAAIAYRASETHDLIPLVTLNQHQTWFAGLRSESAATAGLQMDDLERSITKSRELQNPCPGRREAAAPQRQVQAPLQDADSLSMWYASMQSVSRRRGPYLEGRGRILFLGNEEHDGGCTTRCRAKGFARACSFLSLRKYDARFASGPQTRHHSEC
jgi:ribosome modulation factor